MQTGKTIAFYGVGLMGVPMIARLAAAGHRVRAWNRTFEKAKAIEGGNVIAVEHARDAAEGADIAISILRCIDGPTCTCSSSPASPIRRRPNRSTDE